MNTPTNTNTTKTASEEIYEMAVKYCAAHGYESPLGDDDSSTRPRTLQDLLDTPSVETVITHYAQIDDVFYPANRTARSQVAVDSINASLARLKAAGFVVHTKGQSAGRCNRYPVYVYSLATGGRSSERNSFAEAIYIFDVTYMAGKWFRSTTAVAECVARGLERACESLIA